MTWDSYYLGICNAVGAHSKCLSRQIGAILVRDKVVISTGFNGPPRGYPHCTGTLTAGGTVICHRRAVYPSGQGLHLCPAAHAERNAIVQAARLGIRTAGASLYLNTQTPCKDCLIEIINAGIVEVVCTEIKMYDSLSSYIMENSELKIREFEL